MLLTLEYSDSGREIVHSPRRAQCGRDDGGRGDQIVGKSVVQVTLQLEDVLDLLEFLLVPVVEVYCQSMDGREVAVGSELVCRGHKAQPLGTPNARDRCSCLFTSR